MEIETRTLPNKLSSLGTLVATRLKQCKNLRLKKTKQFPNPQRTEEGGGGEEKLRAKDIRRAIIEAKGPGVVEDILRCCGLPTVVIKAAETLGQLRFPEDETIPFLLLALKICSPETEKYAGDQLAIPLVFQRQPGDLCLRNWDSSVAAAEIEPFGRFLEQTGLEPMFDFFRNLQTMDGHRSYEEARDIIAQRYNNIFKDQKVIDRLAQLYVSFWDFEHTRSSEIDHDLAQILNFIGWRFNYDRRKEKAGAKTIVWINSNNDDSSTFVIEKTRRKDNCPNICDSFQRLADLFDIPRPYNNLETLINLRPPAGQRIYLDSSGRSIQPLDRFITTPQTEISIQKLVWLNQDNSLAVPHHSIKMGDFMSKWQPNCTFVASLPDLPESISDHFI